MHAPIATSPCSEGLNVWRGREASPGFGIRARLPGICQWLSSARLFPLQWRDRAGLTPASVTRIRESTSAEEARRNARTRQARSSSASVSSRLSARRRSSYVARARVVRGAPARSNSASSDAICARERLGSRRDRRATRRSRECVPLPRARVPRKEARSHERSERDRDLTSRCARSPPA